MPRWLLPLLALALPLPAAAQSFLACRFVAGPSLRLALDSQGLALQHPATRQWHPAEDVTQLRDPVVAGFALPVPPEAGGRLAPHESFTLSLDRLSGEARLTLLKRPGAEQVAACRAATEAAAVKLDPTQPMPPPPPCDLAQHVASLAGMCEAQRTRF
jgi:hypothetical protein